MEAQFSISIKDIRAIDTATIALNGITILTGDNGCGKTTISKLLYGFIKTSLNFSQVVTDFYARRISATLSFFEEFLPSDEKFTDEKPPYLLNPDIPYISSIVADCIYSGKALRNTSEKK